MAVDLFRKRRPLFVGTHGMEAAPIKRKAKRRSFSVALEDVQDHEATRSVGFCCLFFGLLDSNLSPVPSSSGVTGFPACSTLPHWRDLRPRGTVWRKSIVSKASRGLRSSTRRPTRPQIRQRSGKAGCASVQQCGAGGFSCRPAGPHLNDAGDVIEREA
jgi:hypothetical protein